MTKQQPGDNRRRRTRRHHATTAAERQRLARQREVDRALRWWTPNRIAGWSLAGTAVLVGVVHWLVHVGWRPLPLSMGAQDLFLGYPTAALLGVAAAVVLGRDRRPS